MSTSYGVREIRVTVVVSDVNDPPVFVATPYSTSIPENSAQGESVLTVSATDRDQGSFGQITYSLANTQGNFEENEEVFWNEDSQESDAYSTQKANS